MIKKWGYALKKYINICLWYKKYGGNDKKMV